MKAFVTLPVAAALNGVLVLAAPAVLERATSLWQPKAGLTWNYLIAGGGISVADATSSKAAVVDIDLFDNADSIISGIQAKGVKVICYFSAGTHEPDRPDNDQFTSDEIGNVVDGWPDENWLDIRSANVLSIMEARIQTAADKGCDAVEPDNVDGYDNDSGFDLTEDDASTFVNALAAKAASVNVAIGLKNAGDIIPDVLSNVQFAVNEECVYYEECDTWEPFISANKPVFHVEYPHEWKDAPSTWVVPDIPSSDVPQFCVTSFGTVLKSIDLDLPTQYCPDGSQVVTSSTTGK